jgi:5'-nucleotidase
MSHRRLLTIIGAAALSLTLLAPTFVHADENDHDPGDDSVELRDIASRPVRWRSADHELNEHDEVRHLKILAFNDFHGHISAGTFVASRRVGGAAVFAAYLRAAEAGIEKETVIVNAGDNVGASPLSSALLADEPTIMFYNQLVNDACRRDRNSERCNFVSTLGNHEFDQGTPELKRLLNGGNSLKGPFLQTPYTGAQYPTVNANVVDAASGKPLVAPYVIREINDVKVAFVGAVLRDTPSIVTPTGVAGLKFLDEADSINRADGCGINLGRHRRHRAAAVQRRRRGGVGSHALLLQRAREECKRQGHPSDTGLLVQHCIR